MRCATWRRIAVVAGVVWLAVGAAGALAADPQTAGQSTATLDAAIARLSAYDFGGDQAPLNALTELAAATHGKPEQRRELVIALSGVLRSGAPRGAKDFACRQLAIIGTAEAVPALAELLPRQDLSHMARLALERIPGPQADEALRQALGKVKGMLLVGVVNSVGNRRDQNAVSSLAQLTAEADPAVACAAAAALGKIGPAAAESLAQALDRVAAPVRPAAADACLLCADALAAEGKPGAAIAIYDRVRGAEAPKPARIAATRGAILARGAGGTELLIAQVRATDAENFALALTLVREMPGPEITKALAAELAKLPPPKQAAVVEALADRGDRAALAAVLPLAEQGEAAVRAAALRALARLGDASVVPLLFRTAVQGEGELAQAARASLASLVGQEVDAAILGLAGSGDVKLRGAAIALLGQRHVTAANALLLKAAADADASIRAAAMQALGETAAAPELPALALLLVQAKTPGEIGAAEKMLGSVCLRLADKESCAERLADAMAQANPEAKATLLRLLGQVGGAKALDAVLAAVKAADEGTRDTAVRVLASWPELPAADHLLTLARSSDSRKYQILALQGCLRLVAQGNFPAERKLAMCKEAMGLAQRDEEKKLVLGALGGVPSAEALAMVVPFLDQAAAKEEAAAAAVAIGEKIAGSHPAPVADAMAKVLKTTQNAALKKRAEELRGRTEKK